MVVLWEFLQQSETRHSRGMKRSHWRAKHEIDTYGVHRWQTRQWVTWGLLLSLLAAGCMGHASYLPPTPKKYSTDISIANTATTMTMSLWLRLRLWLRQRLRLRRRLLSRAAVSATATATAAATTTTTTMEVLLANSTVAIQTACDKIGFGPSARSMTKVPSERGPAKRIGENKAFPMLGYFCPASWAGPIPESRLLLLSRRPKPYIVPSHLECSSTEGGRSLKHWGEPFSAWILEHSQLQQIGHLHGCGWSQKLTDMPAVNTLGWNGCCDIEMHPHGNCVRSPTKQQSFSALAAKPGKYP